MTGLVDGEHRPDIRPVAEALYTLLELHRLLELIPAHAVLRVYAIEDERIMVAVAGLADRFILGEHAHLAERKLIEAHHYTAQALRLRREIEEAVRDQLPRQATGAPWFEFTVWLQTHPWAQRSSQHPAGVTVLTAGELP